MAAMQSVAWLPDAIPQSPSAQKLLPRSSNGHTAPHIRYTALSGAKTMRCSTVRPPAYALAEVTVKDEAGYKNDFLPKIQPVIKENGGVYLAGGFNKTWTQMGQEPPNRVVLIRYDSMDAFKKYAEESNKTIKEDGAKYAAFRFSAIEGIEQK